VDQKTVEKLELKFEKAMIEIMVKMGLKKLPLLPHPSHDSLDGQSRSDGL
jgi:hypothetical protein